MVKVLYAVGFLLFITGACGIESDGNLMLIFGAVALVGILMMYLGWRCERARKVKRKAKQHRRSACRVANLSWNLADIRRNGSL